MMDDEMVMRSPGFCDSCGMIGGHTPDCRAMKNRLVIELNIGPDNDKGPICPQCAGEILIELGLEIGNHGFDKIRSQITDNKGRVVGTVRKTGRWAGAK